MSNVMKHMRWTLLLMCGLTLLLAACGSTATANGSSINATTGGVTPTATATFVSTPTATFAPTPTATATAEPTQAAPTPTPTKEATKAKLTVALTCGGGKQSGNGLDVEHGKACAQTSPGAKLSIKVTYCNGKPDPSAALQGTVTADAHGFYMWQWKPQPDCKGQPIWAWKVDVKAQLNGQTATASNQGMA